MTELSGSTIPHINTGWCHDREYNLSYWSFVQSPVDSPHKGPVIAWLYSLLLAWISCFQGFNTLRLRQNGRHFADDTFKHISLNENVRIYMKISLNFVPYGPINNIPALVQIRTWRRPGNEPLSEPMMVRLSTHICLTRPQWVETPWHSSEVIVMTCVCVMEMVVLE